VSDSMLDKGGPDLTRPPGSEILQMKRCRSIDIATQEVFWGNPDRES